MVAKTIADRCGGQPPVDGIEVFLRVWASDVSLVDDVDQVAGSKIDF